jgi:hypothetical protein
VGLVVILEYPAILVRLVRAVIPVGVVSQGLVGYQGNLVSVDLQERVATQAYLAIPAGLDGVVFLDIQVNQVLVDILDNPGTVVYQGILVGRGSLE